jgi:hypothetical protein
MRRQTVGRGPYYHLRVVLPAWGEVDLQNYYVLWQHRWSDLVHHVLVRVSNRAAMLNLEMNLFVCCRACLPIFCGLICALQPLRGAPSQTQDKAKASSQSVERDGQHDFDFAIGRWKTHLSRLRHPLAGSNEWIDYEGSSMVRKVWDGRANLEEFEANGASGRIEGLTLRLYNPESHQWNQSWSTSNNGTPESAHGWQV